jgi:hypothetical protein
MTVTPLLPVAYCDRVAADLGITITIRAQPEPEPAPEVAHG